MPTFLPVAPARGPVISDATLSTLTQLARDAQHGNCSEAEAQWVLSCAAELFAEVARHRAASAPCGATLNIIALPARG